MKLIGMLDSPYVRRVAISLNVTGLSYAHESLSVFSTYDAFAAINPVVKAPTFITDDGAVLMDSGLILEHLDCLLPPARRLASADIRTHAQAQRSIGLALVACEKTVQIVYERNLRPAQKQHQPWIDRVQGQLAAAYRLLEAEADSAQPWLFDERPLQADITAAVAWRFTQDALPGLISKDVHPSLAAFSTRAEQTDAFRSAPPS